jgi:hypothetical protein
MLITQIKIHPHPPVFRLKIKYRQKNHLQAFHRIQAASNDLTSILLTRIDIQRFDIRDFYGHGTGRESLLGNS